MEAVLGPILAALIKQGSPWIITAVFIVLYLAERKRNGQIADKLYELGMAMTKTNTEVNLTLLNVKRDIDDISRRFKI